MPSVSNTARIGPPAMMPVPGGAARRNTLPAPWRPSTSWCSVRPSRSGTRRRPRLAESVALRMASGTSRALPWPKPTLPFWSPTTTRAAKPKRRPPFTTFATRLMWTSLSMNSLSRSSRSPRSRCLGSRAICRSSALELEAAFASGLRQRFDAPVIDVAAAVEHDLFHALLERAFGDLLADGNRRLNVVRLGRLAFLFVRRGDDKRLRRAIVDDLRVDVPARTEDRQARASAGGLRDLVARALLAPLEEFARHFFLPSLRRMYSSAYFTPLPLYGSGGR